MITVNDKIFKTLLQGADAFESWVRGQPISPDLNFSIAYNFLDILTCYYIEKRSISIDIIKTLFHCYDCCSGILTQTRDSNYILKLLTDNLLGNNISNHFFNKLNMTDEKDIDFKSFLRTGCLGIALDVDPQPIRPILHKLCMSLFKCEYINSFRYCAYLQKTLAFNNYNCQKEIETFVKQANYYLLKVNFILSEPEICWEAKLYNFFLEKTEIEY